MSGFQPRRQVDLSKVDRSTVIGLVCPKCGAVHTKHCSVLESKVIKYREGEIVRTRYCRNCGFAMVTIERQLGSLR